MRQPHTIMLWAAGPAISMDTACSSSLAATSVAARLLLDGSAARGLVTAALLTLDPATVGMLTAASMLAPDGRCKTLDAAADGWVAARVRRSSGDWVT